MHKLASFYLSSCLVLITFREKNSTHVRNNSIMIPESPDLYELKKRTVRSETRVTLVRLDTYWGDT